MQPPVMMVPLIPRIDAERFGAETVRVQSCKERLLACDCLFFVIPAEAGIQTRRSSMEPHRQRSGGVAHIRQADSADIAVRAETQRLDPCRRADDAPAA